MDGPYRLQNDLEMNGILIGETIVTSGTTLVLNGTARADVIVEQGGRAIIHGTIIGCLINLGGEAEIFGTVGMIADAPGVITQVRKGAVVRGQEA